MADFKDWLKAELNERGLTQSDLARKTNLSTAAVSLVMNGKRGVGEEFIQAVAKALNLPAETVFRAAGLLPPVPDDAEYLERFRMLLAYLDHDDREKLEKIGWIPFVRSSSKSAKMPAYTIYILIYSDIRLPFSISATVVMCSPFSVYSVTPPWIWSNNT